MTDQIGEQSVRDEIMDALAKGPVDVFHGTPIEQGGPGHIERGLILEELKRNGVVTGEPTTGKHGAGMRYVIKPRIKKLAEKEENQ